MLIRYSCSLQSHLCRITWCRSGAILIRIFNIHIDPCKYYSLQYLLNDGVGEVEV